jgi:hypothetical protein
MKIESPKKDNKDLGIEEDINNKELKINMFSHSIMPPMDLAKDLHTHGYDILNVRTKPCTYIQKDTGIEKKLNAKIPVLVGTNGFLGKLDKWQERELTDTQFRQGLGYGLRTGEQKNGRKICSFDFDINMSLDEKGKATEQLYKEFLELNHSKDGAFSGGTTGNKNILIDYTDSERFCKVIEGIGGKGSKCQLAGFEIFVGKNNQQVIPPTATECKITGNINTRAWENDKPFLMLNDEFNPPLIDWCVATIQKAIGKKPTTVKKEKPATITPEVSDEEETVALDESDKYYQLLFNVIQNIGDIVPRIDRDIWCKICGALLHNKYPKEMWLKWNYLWKRDTIRADTASDTWDKFKKEPRQVSIYTLTKIARALDETKYKEWSRKYEYFIAINDLIDEYKLAEVIKEKLKEKLVMHFKDKQKTWYLYDEETHMWGKCPNITEPVLREIRLYIDYSLAGVMKKIEDEPDETAKNVLRKSAEIYTAHYGITTTTKWVTFMKAMLETKLASTTFEKTLDQNIGKLVFKNGVYDLETGKFRQGIRHDDFVTKTINMNYKTNYTEKELAEKVVRREFINLKFKQVCNNNDEHFEYYTTWIGFGLIGKPHQEKGSVFLLDKTGGKGDNGKSLAFDALNQIAEIYIYKSGKAFLEVKGEAKVHKKLAEMKGARLVYIDEFSKEQINTELFKEISNGVAVENEIMFGTSEKIPIRFKPFILTNNDPKWKAEDSGAVGNRYNQMSFRSHFDRHNIRKGIHDETKLEFKADTTLLDKLTTTHAQEFLEMFMEGAVRYSAGYKQNQAYLQQLTPASFLADAQETKDKNNPFGEWAKKYLIATENKKDKLSTAELMEKSALSKSEVKVGMKSAFGMDEQRDMGGFTINHDQYGKTIRGGYKNIMYNPDADKDEEENQQEG